LLIFGGRPLIITKSAKARGLPIPQPVLIHADEVIEGRMEGGRMLPLRGFGRAAVLIMVLGLTQGARPAIAATGAKEHHIAIQVDQNDPNVMELVLKNAENAIKYYKEQGEHISIEIVVYGPGLHMLRTDTSPVKDRIKELTDMTPDIKLSACENTKIAMEKSEGHPITILPQATTVPSGIVRLSQLQEQGWSYIRP
jgi:intracellular sulfur oxidation DsrE/DsrF family protein